MAPLHRRPQGLTTPGPAAESAASSRNRSSSRSQQIIGAHRGQPHRGELDRQRQPIQAPADLARRPAVLVRQGEIRGHRHRPVEPAACSASTSARPATGAARRPREAPARTATTIASPGTPSRSRLVHSTRTRLTARHERGHQLPAGLQQVLAVVEHQQEPPLAQVSHQRVLDRCPQAARTRSSSARARSGPDPGHPARPLGQPHALRELAPGLLSRPQREPALADPAGTRQRDHPRASPAAF